MNHRYTESTWSIFAGIRFLLASVVLYSHLFWFVPTIDKHNVIFELGGRAAVLGFLLISGVSIGYSYLHNPVGYLRRRFLRIYPLYFFAVTLSGVLVFLLGYTYKLPGLELVAAGWKTSVANLLFLQGILSITLPFNGPLWTLGVEVFLYLCAPLLAKIRYELLVALIIVSMIIFLTPSKPWLFGYLAFRYSWPWLIGFLLITKRHLTLVAILLAIGVVITSLNKEDTGEVLSWLNFAMVAVSVLLLSIYSVPVSKGLQKVLNFLGELSYPLYLFHFPVYLILYHYAGIRETWLFLLLSFLITIVLNYVLDHWLKKIFWKPLLAWVTRQTQELRSASTSSMR